MAGRGEAGVVVLQELKAPNVKFPAASTRLCRELLQREVPAILVGDDNVVPTELDVYTPERWTDDALFRTEERHAFRNLVA